MTRAVRAALRSIGRHELRSVMSMLVLALGIWAFAEIADEVREGETQGVDSTLLLSLRASGDPADPLGPGWLEEAGRDVTALGGVAVLGMVTVAAVGYLALLGKCRAAAFVAASVSGAVLLSTALKGVFDRARPELVPHLSYVATASFPSGHAMLSTTVYLTLGALLARLHRSLLLKAYLLLWAWLLAVLVGVSRVYVGVHWPTDVLAGWAAGAAWAALSSLVAEGLIRRGVLGRPLSTSAE